jgi:hypothetical protein
VGCFLDGVAAVRYLVAADGRIEESNNGRRRWRRREKREEKRGREQIKRPSPQIHTRQATLGAGEDIQPRLAAGQVRRDKVRFGTRGPCHAGTVREEDKHDRAGSAKRGAISQCKGPERSIRLFGDESHAPISRSVRSEMQDGRGWRSQACMGCLSLTLLICRNTCAE